LVYRITNTVNGKIYIGCHQAVDVEDGYMGSGLALLRAQRKYGIDKFVREILFDCSSKEEMYAKEYELVEFGPHSYNLMRGGYGGAMSAESQAKAVATRFKRGAWFSEDGIARIAEANRRLRLGTKQTEETKRKISEGCKGKPAPNKGKPTSEETKRKLSAALKGRKVRGHKHTEEWKAHMSALFKGRKLGRPIVYTPELRAHRAAKQREVMARRRQAAAVAQVSS
jgi:group I intron endonuclease